MAEMKNFKKDFVERTIDIIQKCSDKTEYDVSLLINCLLGMVTLPIESEKNHGSRKSNDFQRKCTSKLNELVDSIHVELGEEGKIFRNIRNSIAHCNIIIENGTIKGNIERLTFKNILFKKINGIQHEVETLVFTISVKKLKMFALYVATEYLNMFFSK